MDSPPEGISVHSMRLKVLYTFDAEHKNNHLARYPQTIDIQTAFVDEATQIGVIDLKTCLEVVTEASPELLNNGENDFTIYAYDYSEPDTPLVGQGLLSRKLSLQEDNTENDSENMVTGRITKNVMGLFAKNAQQTLEVKLRFNPVAPPNDYRGTSQGSRRGSMNGPDMQSWSNSTPNSSTFLSGLSLQRSASPANTSGLETMQRMLTEGGVPRERSGSFAGGDSFYGRAGSRPPSRPTTPTLPQTCNAPMRQPGGSGSRPGSRAGMHQVVHARRDSFNSGYYSGEEAVEDGPPKKRAKITKIKQPSRSDLNIERQPDSLRVVASSASSVRIHRPIPVNPALALQTGTSAEEPVRPPTPIPSKGGRPRGRPRRPKTSGLNHSSRARPSSPAGGPAGQSLQVQFPDTSMSSPEESRARSASSTPANFPSSPPLMPEHAPPPSSPGLPPLLGNQDSGFMSGDFDDIFGNGTVIHFEEFLHEQTDAVPEIQIANNDEPTPAPLIYAPVFDEGNLEDRMVMDLPPREVSVNSSEQLSVNSIELMAAPRPLSRSQSYAPVAMSSPKLAPAPIPRARQIEDERRASATARIPASDPIGRNLHRSNTWAGDMSDLLTSDAPAGEETRPRNSRKRVGKDQTRARLEAAIASGELPPYCDNCGAIETPAWRRAFRKDFKCPWDDVETSLDDGFCNFKEATEWNEDGSVKSFKGYKTSRRPEDNEDEWVAISLCNPCGLWFHKQKCMRPQEKWQKKDPAEKRKRRARPKSQRTASRKMDGGRGTRSDAATPASDGSSPADTATEAVDADDGDDVQDNGGDSNEPELPPMPRFPRASSAEPTVRRPRFGMMATKQKQPNAGGRATQSSPVPGHGTAREPIELDLTPQPLRRQLFPSPNKKPSPSGPKQSSVAPSTSLPTFVRRSPRLNKTVDLMGEYAQAGSTQVNNPTDASMEDSLDHLFDFDGGSGDVQLPPTTPTPKRRSERIIFKTPSRPSQRTFGDAISPNVQRVTPGLRTPKILSRGPLAALQGTSHATNDMTPFTKSIHDALAEVAQYPNSSPHAPPGKSLGGTPENGKSGDNATFDFPDLPSLKGSSPMANGHGLQFDFSELTTDILNTDYNDVFSTDAPLPSSPPTGFFNFISSHDDGSEGFWGGLGMVNGGFVQVGGDTLSSEPGPVQVLRRSPRKR